MASPYPNPALPPPPGGTSNFTGPVSILKWDILCVAICLSVTTIVFVLWSWARLVVLKQWILEDYMCCVSYIGLITYCALITVTFKRHGGIHEWDLTLPEAYEAIYWFNATSIEYAPAILCTKLTVLRLYRRVSLPRRWGVFDIILRVFMAVCSLYYISTIFVKIWECTPKARIWNKSIEGTCIDVARVLNTDGSLKIANEAKKKDRNPSALYGWVNIWMTTASGPIFSIIGWAARLKNSSSPDMTYNDPEILLWAAAELSAGLICTCLSTIPSLLRRGRNTRGGKPLEMNFHSRHVRTLVQEQPTSLSDQDPFNREYLEPSEWHSQDRRIEALPAAVKADIEGGKPRGIQDVGSVDFEAKDDVAMQRPAPM